MRAALHFINVEILRSLLKARHQYKNIILKEFEWKRVSSSYRLTPLYVNRVLGEETITRWIENVIVRFDQLKLMAEWATSLNNPLNKNLQVLSLTG